MKKCMKIGYFFHIFNKSIANYGIFSVHNNILRFLKTLHYYNSSNYKIHFSDFLKKNIHYSPDLFLEDHDANVRYIAYCIMPDHYHLLIRINNNLTPFSKYISDVENSYTRYFNIKYKRKGPLWQSRYKYKKINTDEQLLHVSRYIHLNPVTNRLIEKPEDWLYSSYRQYISNHGLLNKIKEVSIQSPEKYRTFVESNIDYQRKLKQIKKLMF